jgi:hypothetical protein
MLKQLQILAASAALNVLIPVTPLFADGPDEISFDLVANPKFAACLVNDPSGPAPSAHVTVSRGTANDVMIVELQNFKPGAAFDLFTIQRSQLLADGAPDSNFKSFGLAWYQSDIHVGSDGKAEAVVKSILLDGIFGFDADPIPGSVPPAPLVPPTHTFNVGFWFDSPNDAAACGFDPSKPTPFNSEHKAGPNAMISLPNPVSGLGPLSTSTASTTQAGAYAGVGTDSTATSHCSGGMCITSPH